jgi:hypothetical protein
VPRNTLKSIGSRRKLGVERRRKRADIPFASRRSLARRAIVHC